MLAIQRICSLEFIHSVLSEGADIDQVIEALVLKADAEAKNVGSLEELEGEATEEGAIRILKKCPMEILLDAIRKENQATTGRKELPAFYQSIVDRFIEQNPGEGGQLHPLCIVHQAMRDVIGSYHGRLTRQIACRSASTRKVVFSKNGLGLAGLTESEARDRLKSYACMYMTREL